LDGVVAGGEIKSFSSATRDYVAGDSATYLQWLSNGGTPTRISCDADSVEPWQSPAPATALVAVQVEAGGADYIFARHIAPIEGSSGVVDALVSVQLTSFVATTSYF
jgi:hypothetical protein